MSKAKQILMSKSLTDWINHKSLTKQHIEECDNIISLIRAQYEKNANRANAAKQKKYLRNQFEFYGISTVPRRKLDKEILEDIPVLNIAVIYRLMATAWAEEKREFQYFACGVAEKYLDILTGDSEAVCAESAECLKTLLVTKSWWETVDTLASQVISRMVQRCPNIMIPLMDEWINCDNFWLRRTAIIHQLPFKEKTDSQRLFRYCLSCAHEEEFFIQKAIGWALRQYARVNAKGVRIFVKSNEDVLLKLSYKEAMKHL